ncbi:MAG: hypothetical protein IJN82_06880 [Clostridia bacterium]|nr:hypothetical protein [Clostridia bacterium]
MKNRWLLLLMAAVLLLGGCERKNERDAAPAQTVEEIIQTTLPELPFVQELPIHSDVGDGTLQLTMQPDRRFGLVRHTDVQFGQEHGFHVYSEGFSGVCITLGDQTYSLEEGLKADPTALDRLLAAMEQDAPLGIGEVTRYEGQGVLYTFHKYAVFKCTVAEKELGYGESDPANTDIFIGQPGMDLSVVNRQERLDLALLTFEAADDGIAYLGGSTEGDCRYTIYGNGLRVQSVAAHVDHIMPHLQYKLERDRAEYRCTRTEPAEGELLYSYSDREILLRATGSEVQALISAEPIQKDAFGTYLTAQAQARRQGAKKVPFQEEPALTLEESVARLKAVAEQKAFPLSSADRAAAYRQACFQVDRISVLDVETFCMLEIGVTPEMGQNDVCAFVREIGDTISTEITLDYSVNYMKYPIGLFSAPDYSGYESVEGLAAERSGTIFLQWKQPPADEAQAKEQIKGLIYEYLSREAVTFVEFSVPEKTDVYD